MNLGFGSHIGVVGITYDRDLAEAFQVQLGAGAGFTGWQFSALPRFIARLSPTQGLFMAAGPSLAIRQESPHTLRVWGNVDGGYQYERSYFFTQCALGYTVLIRGRLTFLDEEVQGPGDGFPTIRFALGVRTHDGGRRAQVSRRAS